MNSKFKINLFYLYIKYNGISNPRQPPTGKTTIAFKHFFYPHAFYSTGNVLFFLCLETALSYFHRTRKLQVPLKMALELTQINPAVLVSPLHHVRMEIILAMSWASRRKHHKAEKNKNKSGRSN